ncbi:MAG: class I SAM-dependent DNA methyltransferase, partial [Candidatus Nanoarchaeia archaeon]
PLDDIFVERLRSFHRFITPLMYEALISKLKEDEKFKKEYIRWLKSQMFEYSSKVNETIAEQMSYLLMNKIAFYKTLENQIVDVDIDKLEKIETKSGVDFSERLQEKFKQLTDKADYEGIFPYTILDSVSVPDKLVYHLNEFIEELDAYNLGKIRADVIGRVYEDLIPADDRHRLGQYYTPPPIVDLIVELCVKSPDDKVLDPGCGSGSFLVKAYHKLRDLKKKQNPFRKDDELHQELLEQVYGIDINPFPAQLSSMNLAVRNLKVRSKHISIFPMDFFKVKPGMALLPKELDVVVTNPPYTRQEEMEYKDHIREEALTYSDDSKIDISAQAGIYVYFFTHSAKFLKNTGRMGYITSNTWLDVSFGEGLKQFFLEHFKILAIIEYDAGVFEKAVVDTCIGILEKAEGESFKDKRRKNDVKFIRVKKPMDIKELIAFIEETEADYEDEKIRILFKRQSELDTKEKWGKYLRAPRVYYKLIQSPDMTKLEDIAKARRGYTTGAEEFFYLNKDKIKLWSIEKDYYRPVITSPRKMQFTKVSDVDLDEYLLKVEEPKNALQGKNVTKYIEHGESQGYHLRQTTSSRSLWYKLTEREPAPIAMHRFIRERLVILWNDVKAYVDDSFYEIIPNDL